MTESDGESLTSKVRVIAGALRYDARALQGLPLIVTAWVAVQLVLLMLFDVQPAADTGRYLNGADALLVGSHLPGKAGSYLGYVCFVAVFRLAGLGAQAIVVGQILLSAAAALCMYRLALTCWGERAGWIAAGLYMLYPDVQMWNFYILTDSVFISLLVIGAYLVVRADSAGRWALALLVVGALALVRPNGVIAGAAMVLLLVWRMLRSGRTGTLVAVGAAGVVLGAVAFKPLAAMLTLERLETHLAEGTIIWGYDGFRLPVALPGRSDAARGGPYAIAAALTADPVGFLQLFSARIAVFFGHARPYWSPLHNAFTFSTLAVVYVLACVGAVRYRRHDAVVLAGALILLQAMVVGLTFADWDGRHLDAVLPMIFLIAAPGAVRALDALVDRCTRAG